MKRNYHTHTSRCNHASGTEREYIEAAIKAGYDILGFSDHTPWHYENGYTSNIRMHEDELENYINTVKSLKEEYKDKIEIKIGLESEFFPSKMDWIKDIYSKYKLDYLIFGNHYLYIDKSENGKYAGHLETDEDFQTYVDLCIGGMKTGLYGYLAHPDLMYKSNPNFSLQKYSKQIIKYAAENNIILEYNLAGKEEFDRAFYPNPEFWELAGASKIKAIIGVDAHDANSIADSRLYNEAKAYLESIGCYVCNDYDFEEIF